MVFVLSCQDVPAIADGLTNLFEIAVSEVVEEFLERTPNLEPGMPPGVGTIDVFLESNVLNDVGRMAQRELEVVTLHGVHTTQTGRDGVEVGSIVGAVGGGTKVVDEVACGHDGELMVEHETHEEDGLVVFLA